jgi:hypothetical protein
LKAQEQRSTDKSVEVMLQCALCGGGVLRWRAATLRMTSSGLSDRNSKIPDSILFIDKLSSSV